MPVDYAALAKQAEQDAKSTDYAALAKQAENESAVPTAPPADDAGHEPGWRGQIQTFGENAAQGLAAPFLHPIKTAEAALESTPPGMVFDAITGRKNVGQQTGEGLVNNPAATLGQLTGGAILSHVISGMTSAPGAVKDFAAPDADVSAMKGLRVSAGSPKALKVLGDVKLAKPYLKGANSLEDLQARLPEAKTEVYQPYQDFIEANRHTSLGDSTVGELYDRDKQITAQLGQIKSDPLAMQQAAQKGLNQADLLAEQKAIRSKLFPAAEASGVDATNINRTYGALKGIERQIAGRTSIAVPDEPMGVSRLKNISLKEPLKTVDVLKSGIQDALNGRFRSANPIDTGIEDAFKKAGPKPNLGKYTSPKESPIGNIPYPQADSAFSREPVSNSDATPEMNTSSSRMRVGPDGKIYIEPLALPAPKSAPLLPAEVLPRIVPEGHGDIFQRVAPPSRLKRADLY